MVQNLLTDGRTNKRTGKNVTFEDPFHSGSKKGTKYDDSNLYYFWIFGYQFLKKYIYKLKLLNVDIRYQRLGSQLKTLDY